MRKLYAVVDGVLQPIGRQQAIDIMPQKNSKRAVSSGGTQKLFDKAINIYNIASYLANGMQYAEIEWTPVDTMCGMATQTTEYVYKAGEAQMGLPYSSVKGNDNFVGINVLPETFVTAAMNKNSVLYTKQLFPSSTPNKKNTRASYSDVLHNYVLNADGNFVNNPTHESKHINCNTYYGTVCSTMLSQIFGADTYETTYSFDRSESFAKLFDTIWDSDSIDREIINRDLQILRPGDIVFSWSQSSAGLPKQKRGAHVMVISDIIQGSNGLVVTLVHSGYPNVAYVSFSGDNARQSILMPDSSYARRTILRFKDTLIPYIDNTCFVAVGSEQKSNYSIPALIPDKGNKSHYRIAQGGVASNISDLERDVKVTRMNNDSIGVIGKFPTGSEYFSKFTPGQDYVSANLGAMSSGIVYLFPAHFDPARKSDMFKYDESHKISSLPTDKPSEWKTSTDGTFIAHQSAYEYDISSLDTIFNGKLIDFYLLHKDGTISDNRIRRISIRNSSHVAILDYQMTIEGHTGVVTNNTDCLAGAGKNISWATIKATNNASYFDVFIDARENAQLDDNIVGLVAVTHSPAESVIDTVVKGSNHSEVFLYDTGRVYDLRFDPLTRTISGRLSRWTKELIPSYVSLSSWNGVIKRTAPITKIGYDSEDKMYAEFSIQVIDDDDSDAANGSWYGFDAAHMTYGSAILKAHFKHRWGVCVSLPLDVSEFGNGVS